MPAKIESYANQTNDVKNSVRAATVENITLSGLIVLDGISLSENDRVLVKNQTISSNNGVYTVKSGSWTRSNDANSSSKVSSGMLVLVEEGSVNADTAWILATNNPITLDTSSLSFIKFSPTEIKTELIPGEAINFDYNSQTDALTISAEINTEVIPGEGINFNYNEQTDVLTISSTTVTATALHARLSMPTTAVETFPRMAVSFLVITNSNVLYSFFTPLTTVTVSQITMLSGGTAAAGLTLARMGLVTYDEASTTATLVARCANDTTLFTSTRTAYTRSFDPSGSFPSSYQLVAGTRYGVALLCVGTTMPTIEGNSGLAEMSALTPRLSAIRTAQSDLSTVNATNAQSQLLYARLS
jgi:hypothetical protein